MRPLRLLFPALILLPNLPGPSDPATADLPADRTWLIRVASAQPGTEVEFDLTLAMHGQTSGIDATRETTPYSREVTAGKILAILESKSKAEINVDVTPRSGETPTLHGTGKRWILSLNVGQSECSIRGF